MPVISGTPSFGSRALWWTRGPDVLVCAGGRNKVPRLFTSNNRHSFSPSSGARSLRSRCGQGWLLLRPPLACRRPTPRLCLHVVLPPCGSESSPPLKDIACVGLGPTLMTSFNSITPSKDSVSNYSHILRSCGFRL